MSYTRKFERTITVHYKGSHYVPAKEHGGMESYEGTTHERVVFEVEVDTDPFDDSIDDMKDQVNVLTGAVIATEAAQVESVRVNSRRVGDTIISGFFKTVRSDISQQIAELKIKSEALLVQLNELAKRCRDKKRAMQVDYERISSRYTQIFDELNKELENRIHSLDEPVFTLTRKTEEIGNGVNAHVAVPTIVSAENSRAHTLITAAKTKKQALNTIEKAHKFLEIQYVNDRLLKHCLMPGGENVTLEAPYCYMESVTSPGVMDTKTYASVPLEKVSQEKLVNLSKTVKTGGNDSKAAKIEPYFNGELAEMLNKEGATPHNARVAHMTKQLFSNFTTQK